MCTARTSQTPRQRTCCDAFGYSGAAVLPGRLSRSRDRGHEPAPEERRCEMQGPGARCCEMQSDDVACAAGAAARARGAAAQHRGGPVLCPRIVHMDARPWSHCPPHTLQLQFFFSSPQPTHLKTAGSSRAAPGRRSGSVACLLLLVRARGRQPASSARCFTDATLGTSRVASRAPRARAATCNTRRGSQAKNTVFILRSVSKHCLHPTERLIFQRAGGLRATLLACRTASRRMS